MRTRLVAGVCADAVTGVAAGCGFTLIACPSFATTCTGDRYSIDFGTPTMHIFHANAGRRRSVQTRKGQARRPVPGEARHAQEAYGRAVHSRGHD